MDVEKVITNFVFSVYFFSAFAGGDSSSRTAKTSVSTAGLPLHTIQTLREQTSLTSPSSASVFTISVPLGNAQQSSIQMTTKRQETPSLSKDDLDGMIKDLTAVLTDRKTLFVQWQIESRFSFLVKSGSIVYGAVRIGNCYNVSEVDWITTKLDVKETEYSSTVDMWKTYSITVTYQLYDPIEYTPSASVNVITPNHAPLSPVSDLDVVSVLSSSVTLSWTPSRCEFRGSDQLDYEYVVTSLNVDPQFSINETTHTTILTVKNLEGYIKYSFVVTPVNDAGKGPTSLPVIFQTKEGLPGPPTIYRVTPGTTSVQVFYTQPVPLNGIIRTYRIAYNEEGISNATMVQSDSLFITIKGMKPFTVYIIKVQARTIIGWGSFSTSKSVRTLENLPDAPYGFVTSFRNETVIGIQWQIPSISGGGIVREYKILYSQKDATSAEKTIKHWITSTKNEALLQELRPSTYYSIAIQGRSGTGYGPSLNVTSHTVPRAPVILNIPKLVVSQALIPTIRIDPNMLNTKFFHSLRIYVDEVTESATNRVKRNSESLSPPGILVLLLYRSNLDAKLVYTIGDNSTLNSVKNVVLSTGSIYDVYVELVILFEQATRSDYIKLPDQLKLMTQNNSGANVPSDSENNSSAIVIGIVIVVILIPVVVAIISVIKRLKLKRRSRKPEYSNDNFAYDSEQTVKKGDSPPIFSVNIMHGSLRTKSNALESNAYDDRHENMKANNVYRTNNAALDRSFSFQQHDNGNNCKLNREDIRNNSRRTKQTLSNSLEHGYKQNNLQQFQKGHSLEPHVSSSVQSTNIENSHKKEFSTSYKSEQQLYHKPPVKPPRRRLESNENMHANLRRKQCSQVVEEEYDTMLESFNLDKVTNRRDMLDIEHNRHNETYIVAENSQKKLNSPKTNKTRNENENTSVNKSNQNACAIDVGTQTRTIDEGEQKMRIRRQRRIIASRRLMNYRNVDYDNKCQQERRPHQKFYTRPPLNAKKLQTANTQSLPRTVYKATKQTGNNVNTQKLEEVQIKRKVMLARKTVETQNDLKNFMERNVSETKGKGDTYKSYNQQYHPEQSGGTDLDKDVKSNPMYDIQARKPNSIVQKEINKGNENDKDIQNDENHLLKKRRKRPHSMREKGQVQQSDYRDQDILRFWSKTYSFLDGREVIPFQEAYEEDMHERFHDGDDRPQTVSLELEFRSLPSGVLGTTNIARERTNTSRKNICMETYDHSRVVLLPEGPNDYINASYIKDRTTEGRKAYIATRSPRDLPSAFKFWRMVLQERTRVVVKLSQITDVIPDEISCYSGLKEEMYSAHYTDDIQLMGCIVRCIKMRNMAEQSTRDVYVIHVMSWPDEDRYHIPHDTDEFLSIRDIVRKCQGSSNAPIIVHCNSADGRTGVFIAVDALLREYEREREINVFAFVRNMLKDRFGMIRTIWQFRFIYESLLRAQVAKNERF